MTVGDQLTVFTKTHISTDCAATGTPRPTISWNINGQPLRAGGRLVVQDNGTLLIRNAVKGDQGVYTCTAKNYEGEDSSSSNVHVNGE